MIRAESQSGNYLTYLTNGEQVVAADTTRDKGGGNSGFRPHELLEAALASCMNMTLRMVSKQEGIPLSSAVVTVSLDRSSAGGPIVHYQVELCGGLSKANRERLLASLASCPVRTTLSQPLHYSLGETPP